MLNHDADLEVVQKLLDHVSIATTGLYLRMSRARIREQYDKHHP
jgi:site-specific recombinase XerD